MVSNLPSLLSNPVNFKHGWSGAQGVQVRGLFYIN